MPEHKIPYLNLHHVNSKLLGPFQELTAQVFQNSNYINGPFCAGFERNFAAYSGTAYCSGVSNGLDALVLSLKALGIGVGDEVIVPAHTYIATWLAVTHVGATIVPVDCELDTYTIDTSLIEEKITANTKCIIAVHLYGQACDMGAIMVIAQRHNLYVVEDNAQAHGAEFKGQKTGSFGHINGTSFYPTKNLGALGDAGAITTNDAALYNKVQHLKNYGAKVKNEHAIIGANNRLDELQAAFLNLKLPLLTAWNDERIGLANQYNSMLSGIEGVILPATNPLCKHVYHIYIIRVDNRDALQQHLAAKGIETLMHYPTPVYRQQAYAHVNIERGTYPNADTVAETCLSLPLYPGLSTADVEYIAGVIKEFTA
ncbi:MAG: DegT/DnrJ/EryC1/StrS family aminotransferase [Sphingobacteriales bacterium JAD_PAG50586_3]|nr:MAG: DegT/DnrJ/EryC1/StrS family aminotransferase [Sphingobacteriales bacterium JAD_PAG50586_3]